MSNLKLPNMHDYLTASRELGNKQDKRIGYKTVLKRLSDTVLSVEHHDSKIIEYRADGTILISNAGWDSSTTKDRLHRLTPANVRVFQKDWIQYVQIGDEAPQQLRGWVKVA